MPEGIFRTAIHLYNQDTVCDRLSAARKSWAIYFGDVPQSLTMTDMLEHPWEFHKMDAFFTACAGQEAGFPNYAFIEPTYFGEGQNDQHPPSDVLRGEILLARVYNAIRSNQDLWEKTLLVVPAGSSSRTGSSNFTLPCCTICGKDQPGKSLGD